MPLMQSSIKGLYWNTLAALSKIATLPSLAYAFVYLALRLNTAYDVLGFSAEQQIRFIPKRLWLTRKLMRQPYFVRVSDIRWGGRPDDGGPRVPAETWCGWILDGSWDIQDKRPIQEYLTSYVYSNTTIQIFQQGIPYTETTQYGEMLDVVKRGSLGDWRARGCKTVEDINAHFEKLQRTYRAIQRNGYRTQAELGSDRWFDEIKVFIDRNGELHKQQGAGHHRLAMARVLNVCRVPVVVIGFHKQWAMAAHKQFSKDVITSVDLKIRSEIAVGDGCRTAYKGNDDQRVDRHDDGRIKHP